MNSLFEENKDKLLSLGFAFYGKVPKRSADPERTIVALLPSFFVDRKLFQMVLTWLATTTDFIHVERFKPLSRDLAPNVRLVLGAVAMKMAKQDRRWSLIHDHVKASLTDKTVTLQTPREFSDPYLISKHGHDEEFAVYGVEISKVLPEDQKKVLALSGILHSNRWLRLRAVMGANFRADVAYLYVSGLAGGPAAAARTLGCSRDTAYRNWRALEVAEAEKILKLSA